MDRDESKRFLDNQQCLVANRIQIIKVQPRHFANEKVTVREH